MSRASPPSPDPAPGEVIVEFVRNGPYLRCSAVHAATGLEASAVGPAADPRALERIAVAKLRRLMSSGGGGSHKML